MATDPTCLSSFAILLFLGAATCLGIYGVRYTRTKALADVKQEKINVTRPGFAAVKGEVMPMELFRAPVSEKFCVYCHYEVQYYQSGKNKGWVSQFKRTKYKPFLLTDPTGAVYVDPKFAKVELVQKIVTKFGPRQRLEYNFQQVLESNNIKAYDFFGNPRNLRFVESRIAPEDELLILGNVYKEPSAPTPGNLAIAKVTTPNMFLITRRSLNEIKTKHKRIAQGLLYGGVALTVACIVCTVWYIALML